MIVVLVMDSQVLRCSAMLARWLPLFAIRRSAYRQTMTAIGIVGTAVSLDVMVIVQAVLS